MLLLNLWVFFTQSWGRKFKTTAKSEIRLSVERTTNVVDTCI